MENTLAGLFKRGEHLQLQVSELPTTPEIAKRGAKAYEQVTHALSGKAQDIFIRMKDIRRSFVGTTPEDGANDGTPLSILPAQEIQKVRDVLKQFAPDMALIDHNWIRDKGEPTLSLINLAAAEHIIKNHPDDFPTEAQKNPRAWVIDRTREWWKPPDAQLFHPSDDVYITRYGLLSGFPEEASRFFPRFLRIRNTLQDKLFVENREDHGFVFDYFLKHGYLHKGHVEKLAGIVKRALPDIDTKDQDLFLKSRLIPMASAGNIGFIGVNPDYDDKYVASLNALYASSGIDKVFPQENRANVIDSHNTLKGYGVRFMQVLKRMGQRK